MPTSCQLRSFAGALRFPLIDIEVSKDEPENIALESSRTIDIDEFAPRRDLDPRYYLVPDCKVGHDAFAIIRETVRNMDMVAIGRAVLTNREHIVALEPLEIGLMGTLLRYPALTSAGALEAKSVLQQDQPDRQAFYVCSRLRNSISAAAQCV